MTVLDRLLHTETPTLPAHEFFAAMTTYFAGHITRMQLKTAFEANTIWGPMTVGETDDLDEFFDNIDGGLTMDEIHGIIILGQVGELSKAQVKTFLGLSGG